MRTMMILMLALPVAAQQDGTSDASVARAWKIVQHGQAPKAEEIRVYDFINFHRHNIALPGKGVAVALEAKLLRAAIAKGDTEAAIQIGIATQRADKRTRAINLALVIDKSGSMSDRGKMDYVKKAMEVLIRNLTEDDMLAIVVYDTAARVLRPAARVSDPAAIITLINSIQPGGGTNLHAGLMLGYAQATTHLDPKRSNKVVLLSDGLTNTGVTDTEQIVKASATFNDKGIDLSTVGIGLSYNDKLMNQLAQAGRGTYHFLDSAAGIKRVFEKEIVSLLEKVGKNPVVRITLAKGVTLKNIYGYEMSQAKPGVIEIKLLDLPLALTQVIPFEVAVSKDFDRSKPLAKVRLDYVSFTTQKSVRVEQVVTVRELDGVKEAPADANVLKNIMIARLAQSLHDACKLAHEKRRGDAKSVLYPELQKFEILFGSDLKDDDLKKVLAIAKKVFKVLDY